MASNLSTIGFVFADQDGFRADMLRLAQETSCEVRCPGGRYGLWRSRTGAEIWFHLAKLNGEGTEILGLTPFFEGASDVEIRLERAIHRPDDNGFEGAFHAWMAPHGPSEGSYPFVFESVDFALHCDVPLPAIRRVRLSVFAHEVEAFASDADYAEANRDESQNKFNLAPKAFIPTGLFAEALSAESRDDREPPSPSAIFTGRIAELRQLTNEKTGITFVWLSVATLDATIDVVADPAVVSGNPVAGGTVEVAGVMFGRLLD